MTTRLGRVTSATRKKQISYVSSHEGAKTEGWVDFFVISGTARHFGNESIDQQNP